MLGGTFDPIHLGHLALADAAREALAFDRVLLLPSRVPPHRSRQPEASAAHRLAMTAVACAGRPGFEASGLELAREGPSFTADTLRALQAAGHRPPDLFFLIGADAFAEIATWREFPSVLNLAHFVVCSRPGHPLSTLPLGLPELALRLARPHAPPAEPSPDTPNPAATRIHLIDTGTPAVSSTQVRAAARAGRPLAGLVPPDVETYIRRHGLYGAPPEPDAGASARGRQLA